MGKSARTLGVGLAHSGSMLWPSRDASTFFSPHRVQHLLGSKQRHQRLWQCPWHGCMIRGLLSFGCGQDSKLPPPLQPVADLPAFLLLSAWHSLGISFYALLLGWGGHGICISGGFEEEVGPSWEWSAQVSRPRVQNHLVLAFPSLPSPYTSQENLRLYLEERSPTFDCNLSKGPIVIILHSFKCQRTFLSVGLEKLHHNTLHFLVEEKGMSKVSSLFTAMGQARHKTPSCS